MRSRSGSKGLAFVVALMTVLTIVIPFAGSALAHQPGVSTSAHDLEVAPEIDTNPTGTTHTLTAFVTNADGTNAGAGHLVDFEIESGPAATVNCAPAGGTNPCTGGTASDDGNTPLTPDMTCTTDANGVCQVFFTSQTQGTHVIRAWVDDDTSDATGPAQGDGDPTETRYAGGNDCADVTQPGLTAGQQQGQYGGGAGTASPTGANCAVGTPVNTVQEPDDTDVVEKTWQGAFPQGCVDAEPETGTNARNTTHTITARATSGQLRESGSPAQRVDQAGTFDCEGPALANATISFNIVDDNPNIYVRAVNGVPTGGPTGGDGPDTVTCSTGATGECTFTIELVNQNDTLAGDATNNPLRVRLENAGGTNTQVVDDVAKTWFIAGTTSVVDATPDIDTNVVGQTHTITCRTADAGDAAVAGQTCAARVTGGTTGNQNRDLDNNLATTNGFIGSCETGANGTCTMTYTSTVAGTDTILVFHDPNRSQTQDGTEASDEITKHWVAVGQEPSRIGADIQPAGFCTGQAWCGGVNNQTCNEPTTADDGERNTQGSIDEISELICAQAFAANGSTPAPTQITFTITSGPGQFTNRAGTANLGNTDVTEANECTAAQAPASSGNFNCTFIKSTQPGTTTMTACITGTTTCVTLTKLWFAFQGRNIACTPDTAVNEPGTEHAVTCRVTDAAGNPVQNFFVEAQETGTGRFTGPNADDANFNCSTGFGACGPTDAEGEIVFTTTTSAGQTGEQTITATLAAFHQNNNFTEECERAAGDPTNAPAGNCEDTVTKTWQEDVTPPPPVTECSDNEDNDGDGLVDMDDPDCGSPQDDSEGGTIGRGEAQAACSDPAFQGTRTNIVGGGQLIVGTPGADALVGTGDDDIICGLGGNDAIEGKGGNDTLLGQAGDDTVKGGGGKDDIRGAGGNDNLVGGGGPDSIRGGGGNDTAAGRQGKDVIRGGGGRDALSGNGGNDLILGGSGKDSLKGNAGIDTLRGGGGGDTLQGGRDDDVLKGGSGNDILRGWTGDDALDGGPGSDQCFGGRGDDSLRRCE